MERQAKLLAVLPEIREVDALLCESNMLLIRVFIIIFNIKYKFIISHYILPLTFNNLKIPYINKLHNTYLLFFTELHLQVDHAS